MRYSPSIAIGTISPFVTLRLKHFSQQVSWWTPKYNFKNTTAVVSLNLVLRVFKGESVVL